MIETAAMNHMAILATRSTERMKEKKPKLNVQTSQRMARIAATTETICTTIFNLPSSLASMVKPSEAAIERKPEIRNSRPTMITATQTLTIEGISSTRAM